MSYGLSFIYLCIPRYIRIFVSIQALALLTGFIISSSASVQSRFNKLIKQKIWSTIIERVPILFS